MLAKLWSAIREGGFVVLLAAASLATLQLDKNPIVAGRATGLQVCRGACARFGTLVLSANDFGGDSAWIELKLTMPNARERESPAAPRAFASLSGAPLYARSEVVGDTLIVSIARPAPTSAGHAMFYWPSGDLLALDVVVPAARSTSRVEPARPVIPEPIPPVRLATPSHSKTGAAAPTLDRATSRAQATQVDTVSLTLLDWRVWMKGGYDSPARQRGRSVLFWLSACALLGGAFLAVRTGRIAESDRIRKSRQEDEAQANQGSEATLVLTAETCTRLLIEEIGRESHVDASDEQRILRLSVLGTAGLHEVYHALGVDPAGPWPERKRATRLIAQAKRSLLERVEHLIVALAATQLRLQPASQDGGAHRE